MLPLHTLGIVIVSTTVAAGDVLSTEFFDLAQTTAMSGIPHYSFRSDLDLKIEITTMSKLSAKGSDTLSAPHRIDFYAVYYFTRTGGRIFIDAREHKIKTKDLFVVSDEQILYFRELDKIKGNVILFDRSFVDLTNFIDRVLESDPVQPLLSAKRGNQQLMQPLLCLIDKTYATDSNLKGEILKRYLEIIAIELLNYTQTNPQTHDTAAERFRAFKNELKASYRHNKSVAFYANIQGVTPKTLNAAVRSASGKSAKQYINHFLLQRARRLLLNTSDSVSEISHDLGFDEVTNFSKFFKNAERLSPSAFRAKHTRHLTKHH